MRLFEPVVLVRRLQQPDGQLTRLVTGHDHVIKPGPAVKRDPSCDVSEILHAVDAHADSVCVVLRPVDRPYVRDAQDRVEGEYDSIKLQRLLEEAVLNGDEPRAHAIVENAIDSGDSDTVEAFQRAYPALAEATARLWDVATHSMTTTDVTMAWRLAALKPPALQSLADYEIAAAASGQTNAWQLECGLGLAAPDHPASRAVAVPRARRGPNHEEATEPKCRPTDDPAPNATAPTTTPHPASTSSPHASGRPTTTSRPTTARHD